MYATTNIASTVVKEVPFGSGTWFVWVTRKMRPVTAKPVSALRISTRRSATFSNSKVGSRLTT